MAIQPVPDAPATVPFPGVNDKAAGTYNALAYAWGNQMPVYAGGIKALGDNVFNNATDAKASADIAMTKAAEGSVARDLAVAAAASAINAPGTQATSSTSLVIGTGSKAMIITTGKAFAVGQQVVIARTSDAAKRMFGGITAHDPATGGLTVLVATNEGSGTYNDWTVSLSTPSGSGLPPVSGGDVGKVLGVVAGPAYGLLATRGAGGATPSGNTTLTAASAGVQRITPTGPGQWVQEADATTMTTGTAVREYVNLGAWDVEIRDATGAAIGYILPGDRVTAHLGGNATAAGVWDMQGAASFGTIVAEMGLPLSLGTGTTGRLAGAVGIDANRELLLLTGDTRMYGVVWDAASSTFGTPVLIRSANVGSRVRAINSATDQALVISSDATTALQAVALTITGTTITVNTAATATLAGDMTSIDDLIAVVGQGFVVAYRRATSTGGMRALTVTGTTVAIGAESLTTGDNSAPAMLWDVGSNKVIVVDTTSATITIGLRTVAGTTLTAGTAATLGQSSTSYMGRMLASGRVALIYRNNATSTLSGAIVSVSGTVVSTSAVTISGVASTGLQLAHVVGSQVIVGSYGGGAIGYVNVLTDNVGTAVAGTEIVRDRNASQGPYVLAADSTSVTMWMPELSIQATGYIVRVGVSGNNPTVLAARYVSAANYADGGYSRPSSVRQYKEALPEGVLRGTLACVAGLNDTRNLLWVSRGGMPMLVPGQPLQWLQGGQGSYRSASSNWEWSGVLVQTGLTVALQKLKVA